MGRRGQITGLLGVFLLLGLGYLGWAALRSSDAQECYACNRPVHAHSRTVAVANGRARQFCCPACALSQHEQSGKPVRITQLTSFLTGRPLAPDQAYVVKGSDVNMCATRHEIIGADKRPADMHYDRCAPSILAFERRSDAEQFARQHGGTVAAFPEVAAAFAR